MSITYERVLVTPSMARQWLDKRPDNQRTEKRGKITAYARDMKSGRWDENTAEFIKFDVNDKLIDGQNRLLAVILADIPITFDVAHGLPSAAMLVLDSGAPRGASDAMKIANVVSRARSAAIVRWSILWDAGFYTGMGGTLRPTNMEIVERYAADQGIYNAAASRATDCQNRGLATGAPAGVAYYLFSRIDQESAHGFFDQYVSGANLPDRSSILALRNRMAKVRVDRITRPEQLALFIRAWNAYRDSRPMDSLIIVKAKPGSEMPAKLTNDNFPQPK